MFPVAVCALEMRSSPIDVRERPPSAANQFCLKDRYETDIESVLVSGGEIESRIACLADEISREYRGRDDVELYVVCVLKGAMRFFNALVPQLDPGGPVREGVVRASRYAAGGPEAERTAVRWLERDRIEGRDVLVVEDVIDEGFTLETILARLEEHDPNSIEVTVLFDKAASRKTDVDVGFTGFFIPDEFVVGYGLDYDERYRDLRHLAVLDETAMQP